MKRAIWLMRLMVVAVAAGVYIWTLPSAFGLSGSSAGNSYPYPYPYPYEGNVVTICHHTSSKSNPTVTITVAQDALPAHLSHGDTVGACP